MLAGAGQAAGEEEGEVGALHLLRGQRVGAEGEGPRAESCGQAEVAEAGHHDWGAGVEERPCPVGWAGAAEGRRQELWTGEEGEEPHVRLAPEEEGEGRSRGEGEEEGGHRGMGAEEAELVF